MNAKRIIRVAMSLALSMGLQSGGATPLSMRYSISPLSEGLYLYRFVLTLDNHDSSWISGMNFNWIIFGDGFPDGKLGDFIGDVDSLSGGPFTEFTTSGGGNNGPTLLDFTPTIETGGWIPASVGSSLAWSGTSRNYVGAGLLLFSNAQGSPNSPAYFEVASLMPVPELPKVAMLTVGLVSLVALANRRREPVAKLPSIRYRCH